MTLPSLPKQAYVGVSAIAQYLGVSGETVRKWVKAGHFPGAVQAQRAHYADSRPRKTKQGAWHVPLESVERFLGMLRSGRV